MKKTSERVTHVSISIFQMLFRNIGFRYVALVVKKLCAILDYFSRYTQPCALNKTKKFTTKKSLNFFSLTVTKFHDERVKTESVGQNKLQGGERQTQPPPSLFRVK